MSPNVALSGEEFERLRDFLYRKTGIMFSEAKRYFVERRVADRMSAAGIGNFPDYFTFLRADAGGEIEHFINAVTVNETYFYREEYQFQCLTQDLLRERLEVKSPAEAVRLWSVPCSSGEEPYSLAIWLLENWPTVDSYDVEICGSDIDTNVLQDAREAVYGERALMRLPAYLVERYFERRGPQRWQLIDDIRQSIALSQVNVLDIAGMQSHGAFDVIFCRNMLIYFDDASRRRAAENLFDCLKPGGFLCLGHSESMSRISPLFEARRYADAIVYRRPQEGKRS